MIHFDLASLKEKVIQNEKLINSPSFWDNQKEALEIVNQNNQVKSYLDTYEKIDSQLKEVNQIYLMLKEEYDEEIYQSLENSLADIEKSSEEFQIEVLLSNEFD